MSKREMSLAGIAATKGLDFMKEFAENRRQGISERAFDAAESFKETGRGTRAQGLDDFVEHFPGLARSAARYKRIEDWCEQQAQKISGSDQKEESATDQRTKNDKDLGM